MLRQKDVTSKFSPGLCIITILKVSSLGKNRTTHEENGSLLWIFRIPTHSHWSIKIRSRKMKRSLNSQNDHYMRGVREQPTNKSMIRKPLMLRDSDYWQMSVRGINLSSEDSSSSKLISYSASIYFANWISLWLIWDNTLLFTFHSQKRNDATDYIQISK